MIWPTAIQPACRSVRSAVVGVPGRLVDLEDDATVLAVAGDAQDVAERLGDAALTSNHLAGVIRCDGEFDDGGAAGLALVHLDGVGIVNERAGNEFDERFHRSLTALRRFGGALPCGGLLGRLGGGG